MHRAHHPGEDPSRGVETLEQAASLLPALLQIRLWLGEAYLAASRVDEGRALLRSVVAWGHGGSLATRASELLEGIGDENGPMSAD